ncbi:response regulator [Paenibacillus silagei]|uniref:Two-component system response regulator YesN n=1 Tax=Paenibacillus silagei TaxID=1670801 RepID=A0ABS4P0G8_9BACL|nr:response regulator [Paenibacillus silagei]MBP2115798.1 two-component system response regulator YesN [Paenibacillus silagei]
MKYKVLLIDDEPSALEGMEMWIDWQELGFELCGTCGNGREGLQMMKQLQPDLVITDIHMPLMNGLEMIGEWRQEGTDSTKFVILSGYSEFEYARKAISYGINHYLLKPVFPEEATEELREIRLELEQEANRRRIHETASGEEAATLIKGLLYGKKGEPELMEWLETLPGFKESNSWNICLIRTVPELYSEVRNRTVSLLTGYKALVTIDLEAGLLGIVYGMTEGSGDAAGIAEVLVTLLREYGGENIHIALGTPEDSLESIEGSYGRAKETLLHFFYEPEQAGVLAYSEVQDKPFSYHYDHIGLMDALLDCVNLLDTDGYREALEAAARSFREQQVAPEVVRKFVIHLMYRIFALAPGAEAAGEEGGVASGVEVSEVQQAMTPLSGLLSRLLSYGGKAIDLLVQEQNYKSHGIVREINQYIGEHYQESLSIQKLAEIFFLHPVYLGQLLIKKNGMTFNEQLHHLRIQAAAELLRGSRLKLSEIAERVGYANYGQFLKRFEKELHMGPNEYRHAKF